MKKASPKMDFEAKSQEDLKKLYGEKRTENILEVVPGKMKMTSIGKHVFAQLTQKRFVFSYSIVYILIGHPCFENLRKFKMHCNILTISIGTQIKMSA